MMNVFRVARRRRKVALVGWLLPVLMVVAGPLALPDSGSVRALINAEIIPDADSAPVKGVVVIRDGVIEAAGPGAAVPPGAWIEDLQGGTVSAGWIDLYVPASRFAKTDEKKTEPPGPPCDPPKDEYWMWELASVRPDHDPLETLKPDADAVAELRSQGITTALVVPESGVWMGYGGIVDLGDQPVHRIAVAPRAAQCLSFENGTREDCYPVSLMGAAALIRQTFLDADWLSALRAWWNIGGRGPRPPRVRGIEALQEFRDARGLFVFRADRPLDVVRAASLAREFDLRAVLAGTGHEYRYLAELTASRMPVILPLAFPRLAEAKDEDDWLDTGIGDLRHWDRAPSAPRWLENAGVPFAFTSRDLKDVSQLRSMLGVALARGLSRRAARAALTTVPARLAGLETRAGKVAPGMLANLIVSRGDPLLSDSVIEAVWVDGRRFEVRAPGEKKPPKNGADGTAPRSEGSPAAQGAAPPVEVAGYDPPGAAGRVLLRGATLWTAGPEGVLPGYDLLIEDGRIAGIAGSIPAEAGTAVVDLGGRFVTPGIIDGHSHAFLTGELNESPFSSSAEVRAVDAIDSESRHIPKQLAAGVTAACLLHGSANAIGGQSAVVKLRWGRGPEEMILRAAPPGIKFALGENVKQSNWGERYTKRFPQTRMGVESFLRERFMAAVEYDRARREEETAAASRLPAEGLAKGLPAEALATGLPAEALAKAGPVRRSLELEALAEVLAGKRFVHCHAYRADEMLMLMKLAEEFGFRVKTFEHSAEAYKIAGEIRKHGAGVSGFPDWWAYKFEVYDAIPYNHSLLYRNGVVSAFGSDSPEYARRLLFEAPKAIKYGGMPDQEALRLVTRNPAIQLGIDSVVGTLEVGKDADLAVWSAEPLSSRAVCEQTWIDGVKVFDRGIELGRQRTLEKERETLIGLAREPAPSGGQGKTGKGKT